MPTPLLEARDLLKNFPGVRALRGVSLAVHQGEVVAVVGENGAGKSTLMKILAGVHQPDGGSLVFSGRPIRLRSVTEAHALGIALIHQELNLAGNLDVAANVFLGREGRTWGMLDARAQRRLARPWLEAVGLSVDPGVRVDSLGPGQRQLVEIARALAAEARLLIMDEPTSSLSEGEAARLHEVIGELRRRGVGIVYISHRLPEIRRLADRAVVLRDGAVAGELARGEMEEAALVRLMVGREIGVSLPGVPALPQAPVLEIDRLRTAQYPRHAVSFSVRPGEVVGLAGLVGSGRTALLESIFGVSPVVAGSITVNGRPLRPDGPARAMEAGLALVPEDRQRHGLLTGMPTGLNLTLPTLGRHRRFGWFDRRSAGRAADRMIAAHRIRTPNGRQPVRLLSGGNQQKVVLAKWLEREPSVLMLDEPTRGVDVGAKQEIYDLIGDRVAAGLAVLFASSEMEELLRLADRALVLHEGRLAGELTRRRMTEESIMHLATGGGELES